ncbi:hypothetical protein [Haloarcula rubripromontorii]|uniref:hypothetical protein n=1 Tax=Haloarcula rubripromontorii TaxID=1705562 RepID=UPI00345B8C47
MPEDVGTTQWQFRRAYESGDLDSDELGTALKRYDELDSDGKDEFDDLLARNGDDAADFAGRTDSDTFDAVISPCGARGAPSLGGAGSFRTDRYHSVATPPSTLAQSGGSCPELPDDVENDLQDALTNVDGDLDADDVNDVRQSISELDGDGQDAATDLIDGMGDTGVSTVNDADALSDSVDGLSDGEVGDLIVSYDSYRRAEFDGARSPRDVQDDLDQLANAKDGGVDGLDSMIRERTGGGNAKNFRGVDGAAQDATEKLDDGVDPNNLHLEDDIELDQSDIDDVESETDLDPDTDLFEETDIDVNVDGGSSTEIKKTDFEPFAEADFAYRRRAEDISDLWKKLNTIAAHGDGGSITITVSRGPDRAFSDDVLDKLRTSSRINTGTLDTDEISTLGDVATEVESDFGIEIRFERFSEGD